MDSHFLAIKRVYISVEFYYHGTIRFVSGEREESGGWGTGNVL